MTDQRMVNCWFGARWFGIQGIPPRSPIPFIFGDPRNPNHRAPNQQLTISWTEPSKYCWWFRNPVNLSWGWYFIPWFTRFYTSKTVVGNRNSEPINMTDPTLETSWAHSSGEEVWVPFACRGGTPKATQNDHFSRKNTHGCWGNPPF